MLRPSSSKHRNPAAGEREELLYSFFEKLLQTSEGHEGERRGGIIYRQLENSDQEKRGRWGRKGRGKGMGGGGACLLRTCPISGTRERGSGGSRGGETGVLLTTAKLSPTTRGHFSGTFLQFGVQKELAGGVVNLFPMYTPSPRARM